MGQIAPEESDFDVDLESGGAVSEEDSSKEPVFGAKKQAKMLFSKTCGGFVDETSKAQDGVNKCCNLSNSNGVFMENVKVGGDENVDNAEKKTVKEKYKKTSNKKPPKPPRPPRGPSLDAADQKLIKEISELATLKRARIERMKALKKMKVAKAASFNSNLFAMVCTVLFCLVIIFQGMSSGRSSSVTFQGSPVSAGAIEGDLISVQYMETPLAFDSNGHGSVSPNLVEQVAGSDLHEEPRRVDR